MTNNERLATYLKLMRNAKNLSIKSLSDLSGVSKSYISRIEKSERFPSAAKLNMLAPHLGVGLNELLYQAGYFKDGDSLLIEDPETIYLISRLTPNKRKLLLLLDNVDEDAINQITKTIESFTNKKSE